MFTHTASVVITAVLYSFTDNFTCARQSLNNQVNFEANTIFLQNTCCLLNDACGFLGVTVGGLIERAPQLKSVDVLVLVPL